MKLYLDEKLTQEIIDCFSFGVVPVGETEQVTIWIKNDDEPKNTGYLIDLKFEVVCVNPLNDAPITDEKIEVIEAPKELSAFAVAPLVLEWTPNIDLEQGLKARLIVTGQKIIG